MAWTEDFSAGLIKTIGALEILAAVGLILPAVHGIAPVLVPRAGTARPASRDPTAFVPVPCLVAAVIGRGARPQRCAAVWSLVAVAIVGGAGLAVRIRAEKRQLTQALGTEYQHFAAGRKRLVPGLW